jgi:hypothetical protein
MNDLRRIGKTKIIRKMYEDPSTGWLTSFSDLEGTHTAEEFAALVYKDSTAVLATKQWALRKMTNLLGKVGGAELAGVLKLPDGQPAPWKEVLRTTFSDINETLSGQPDSTRMVFFWDEVPYLLENIAKRQGKDIAEQVLDLLRELSQRYDRIRLLLTGSIGIHHVLASLYDSGYKGSPLNHMDLIQPGPLAMDDAKEFAAAEIARRGLRCTDADACVGALSELGSHVPFYIEKLAVRLPIKTDLNPSLIENTLVETLTSVNNDWDLDYYFRRVKAVFPQTDKLVLTILDILARSPKLSFQEIRQQVSAKMSLDEEVLREHLKLLCMDHYLVKEANEYRFYLTLVRRWWTISRDLN